MVLGWRGRAAVLRREPEEAYMTSERLLYYTDLSPEADLAFPLAASLAQAQGAVRLFVLHVLHSVHRFHGEIIEPGLAMALNPELMAVAERSMRGRYDPALARGVEASWHVASGIAGIEVLRFIRRHAVDQALVALAVARRELPSTQGTLEAMLLDRSPCPVLFLSPGRGTSRREARVAPPRKGRSNVLALAARRTPWRRGARPGACGQKNEDGIL
jgi:hypothetical protein